MENIKTNTKTKKKYRTQAVIKKENENKIKKQIKYAMIILSVFIVSVGIIGRSEVITNKTILELAKIEPVQAAERVAEKVEVKKGRINEITMYTSMPIQTDSTPCIGANGQDVCVLWKKGQNICATNAYPIGTELHIDKLGDCLVTDRMNKRYKNRIDWYAGYDLDCLDNYQAGDVCPNYQRALKFGMQKLFTYVK